MSNVVDLPIKEPPVKGYIKIIFKGEEATAVVYQADSFGIPEELPGFIALWSDSEDGPSNFINVESIRSIQPLTQEQYKQWTLSLQK